MNTAPSSINNYRINLTSGHRLEQVGKVLEVYKQGGDYTDREIESITGIRSNTVSARRNELHADGLIEWAGDRVCKVTGRRVQSWKIKVGQMSLFS